MIFRFEENPRQTGPLWAGPIGCVVVIVIFSWLRLAVFEDRVLPLSAGLPLLLCLWNRDLRLLYGMALALTAITFFKVLWVMPEEDFSPGYEAVLLGSQFFNIWIVGLVLHGLLEARAKVFGQNLQLRRLNEELEAGNDELAASNAELAAREEEISHQNEELQNLAEELEEQSEELRQQTEELEQQQAELQELNRELMRREKGLETLLNSGRWMRSDMSEAYVMSGVCQAALQILTDDVKAADVVANQDGRYEVWGDCGFGLQGRMNDDLTFDDSFAALVIASGRTTCIEDIRRRDDLHLPALRAGSPFLSVLATPIWYEGKAVAALCLYSSQPKVWTEHDFGVADWLASQAALGLQSIRFQKELEARRRDAENAALQKSQFLAAVSHDVRTPANAISLLAELIERAAGDPQTAARVPELAKSLWSNARSLVDLVSDVLDLTRLDAGAADLHVTEFRLHEFMEGEISLAESMAAAKGLPILRTFPEEPLLLATDRTKLKRILANLLSNAVKFTERGSIRVSCVQADGHGLEISVKDTGVGIPAESREQVFDEFFQLKNPERNRDKGAGLGLAICKRLAANLGCQIAIESLVGVGTTLTLTLPPALIVRPVLGAEQTASPAPADGSELREMRILLVEDNDVARGAIAELLADHGADIVSAATGREALRILDDRELDVLLLDLNLPDMDGSEILQKLAVSRPASLSKILVISGDARPERHEQVKLFGADELLAKPVSLARIRAAILAAP